MRMVSFVSTLCLRISLGSTDNLLILVENNTGTLEENDMSLILEGKDHHLILEDETPTENEFLL